MTLRADFFRATSVFLIVVAAFGIFLVALFHGTEPWADAFTWITCWVGVLVGSFNLIFDKKKVKV